MMSTSAGEAHQNQLRSILGMSLKLKTALVYKKS